jgi:hypothetical protein
MATILHGFMSVTLSIVQHGSITSRKPLKPNPFTMKLHLPLRDLKKWIQLLFFYDGRKRHYGI